jgi:inositol hexakisphosphate/diphosphoinositol-pentakisphosphate kinase
MESARSVERRPAGGESFLLMHARWKKLEQDIYHEKKRRFDISKVPDVYDSAKYDAIHNEHLKLEGLDYLLPVAKILADGVVPNEYGTHPHSRLRVGATIARDLIRKLLMDLGNTRNESFGLQQVPCVQTDPAGSSGNMLEPPTQQQQQAALQTTNVSTWQKQLMQTVQKERKGADTRFPRTPVFLRRHPRACPHACPTH